MRSTPGRKSKSSRHSRHTLTRNVTDYSASLSATDLTSSPRPLPGSLTPIFSYGSDILPRIPLLQYARTFTLRLRLQFLGHIQLPKFEERSRGYFPLVQSESSTQQSRRFTCHPNNMGSFLGSSRQHVSTSFHSVIHTFSTNTYRLTSYSSRCIASCKMLATTWCEGVSKAKSIEREGRELNRYLRRPGITFLERLAQEILVC